MAKSKQPKTTPTFKERARRLRWAAGYPKPIEDIVIPWADETYAPNSTRIDREVKLRAEQVILATQTPAWARIVRPAAEAIDAKRKKLFRYSIEDLLTVELLARNMKSNIKETRAKLAGDDGEEARKLLGFNKSRNDSATDARMRRRKGVPSESTLSRLNRWFPEHLRAAMWEEFATAVRDEHLEMPEMQAELDHIIGDGSYIETRYSAPIIKKSTGEIVNDPTALTAGYNARGNGIHGWNLVSITTPTYIPLVWSVELSQASEVGVGTKLVEDELGPAIGRYRQNRAGVATFDSAFAAPRMRAALRQHNYVDNIHECAHWNEERAKELNDTHYDIEGFPGWKGNGHREIFCVHGVRASKRPLWIGKKGVSVAVDGRCDECAKIERELKLTERDKDAGTISMLSGDYRLNTNSENPTFVQSMPSDPVESRDWALGNPLTYNDLNSRVYGHQRWSRGEGFHSALANRFELNAGKRWVKTHNRARIETAMTFALIHVIAMDYRLQQRAANEQLAPPLAAAA